MEATELVTAERCVDGQQAAWPPSLPSKGLPDNTPASPTRSDIWQVCPQHCKRHIAIGHGHLLAPVAGWAPSFIVFPSLSPFTLPQIKAEGEVKVRPQVNTIIMFQTLEWTVHVVICVPGTDVPVWVRG